MRRADEPELSFGDRIARVPLLAVFFTLQLATIPLFAADGASEEAIKAAMVYRFLDYTTWPETAFVEADSPYRIWVLGARTVAEELSTIADLRRSNNRSLEVFTDNRIEQMTTPHVVYVGELAERMLPAVARLAEAHAILVITESSTGLPRGSTVNLRLIDDRIAFEVSIPAAERSRLKLSARLLSVAHDVEQ